MPATSYRRRPGDPNFGDLDSPYSFNVAQDEMAPPRPERMPGDDEDMSSIASNSAPSNIPPPKPPTMAPSSSPITLPTATNGNGDYAAARDRALAASPDLASPNPRPPSESALDQFRRLRPPEPPKSGVLKTIGTALLANRFGEEGATRLMHPRYSVQRDIYNQQVEDLGTAAKMELAQRNLEATEEQKQASAAQKRALTFDLEAKREDRATDVATRQAKADEERLKAQAAHRIQMANLDGKQIGVDDPVPDGYQNIGPDFWDKTKAWVVPQELKHLAITKEWADSAKTAAGIGGLKEGQVIPWSVYTDISNRIADATKQANKPDPIAKENPNVWNATLSDPNATPEEKRAAKEKLDREVSMGERKARAGAQGRLEVAQTPAPPIQPNTPEFRVAQDMAYGKLTMQQFRALYSYSRDINKKLSLYDKARELNPDFNPALFEAGFTLAKSPKVQQQLASMDNVIQATPDLLKFSDMASRTGLPILNKLVLPGGYALGGKRYSNLHLARTAYADELSGALGFGSATDMSRQMGFDMTDPNLSPEAFRAGIEEVVQPFVERKRATLLKQMGPYGQPGMNPANPVPVPAPVTPPASRPPITTFEKR